ncbi:hypothetical protein [Micromonospora sp. NPDC047074]|uniref:hypothetical protein n=1 Tax=Micromonospora sp. NPDC047074 TaxID=3154339 RepID=UPI0033F7ACC5
MEATMPDGSEPAEARLPVRVVTILGLFSVAVLLVAGAALVVTWPTAPHRSSYLPIRLHAYDPATARVEVAPQVTFRQGQIPAAAIAEPVTGSLMSERVRATWYDKVGYQTNSVDLAEINTLRTSPVPLSTTSAVPAGTYQFVLATIRGDRVEEVLAWVHVEIER